MSSPKINYLFAAGLMFGLWVAPARAELAPGAAFPSLAAADLEGVLPATEGRILVVDFWASWCAPCKASFPSLGRLHAEFTERGVTILGVSVDKKPAAYAAFLKAHTPPFATVRDQAHKLAAAAQVPAMPTTFVVGRDGRVRAVFTGYHGEKTDHALRAALNEILSEKNAQ